ETRAKVVLEQSEQFATETRRTARREADQVAEDARRAAEAAARARVGRISELRASIAARAGSLVEGLEGGELTAARLEELVDALGEAEERILAEVGGAPEAAAPGKREASARPARGGDRDVIAWPARPGERPAAARPAAPSTRDGAAEPSADAQH